MYTNAMINRLIDYYFVVSCDDRGIQHIKEKLQHKIIDRYAPFALKPKIIDRYPHINIPDTPLACKWIATTAMPRGIRAMTEPPPPKFFTFIGWNIDTSKLYASCLMVFEKIEIANQLQTVYIPKTLGFLSHYPYFYTFNIFLRCLYHIIPKQLIPLEDLLIHYFYDIPAPEPSKKIAYDLGEMKIILACRNEFDMPILEIPMEIAFTQLSKDKICFIVKLLLLERRLIFICGDFHLLTPICELFISLLFPLRWRHLYMPLLTRNMFKNLIKKYTNIDNNIPFIIGLPYFVYDIVQSNIPNDSFLIFIDKNEIRNYKNQIINSNDMIDNKFIPNIPNILNKQLNNTIYTLAKVLIIQSDEVMINNSDKLISREYTIQAFRNMFRLIIKLIQYSYCHNKFNNHQFITQCKKTKLFKSFIKYYKRINGINDKYLTNINQYYKLNEGHGKNFARKVLTNYENDVFDIKLYNTQIYNISKHKIKQLEINNNNKFKTRNNKFKTRNKEFIYPKQVKTFLKICIWKNNYNKQKYVKKINKSETNILAYKNYRSRKMNKLFHYQKLYQNRNNGRDQNCCLIPLKKNNNPTKTIGTSNLIIYENRPITIAKYNNNNNNNNYIRLNFGNSSHILNKSISLNMTDIALQTKIDRFCNNFINNKNNLQHLLKLCLEMERKISRNISKGNNNKIKQINWRSILYDAFMNNNEAKKHFIESMNKLCDKYSEYKGELSLLLSVVDMLNVNILEINQRTSQLSLYEETELKEEEESTSESDNSDSSDDDTDDNTDTDTDTDSSWPIDSNDDINQININNEFNSNINRFTKLDEFNITNKEIEWFYECEILHNNVLGCNGIKYIDNQCIIGVDFIDDYIINHWTKNNL